MGKSFDILSFENYFKKPPVIIINFHVSCQSFFTCYHDKRMKAFFKRGRDLQMVVSVKPTRTSLVAKFNPQGFMQILR
ncbi:MAG: hypothetical protein FWF77_00130 [Defluviitaleaceae bacterium]|nr:hypothetical protein [Defluviitaleaceae bacterium]